MNTKRLLIGAVVLGATLTHNGYFKTLAGVVHFYNTRDVLPRCAGNFTEAQALAANCWPAPEVAANMNTTELGNLRLSPQEEAELVAFMQTLSDGFNPTVLVTSANLDSGSGLNEILEDGMDDGVVQMPKVFLPLVVATTSP